MTDARPQTPDEKRRFEEQLLEFTRKYYGQYRDAYESYTHDPLRENYQLMMLYDPLLVQRQKEATRIIRGTINIPKMQPELYARLSQETKMLLHGAPIFKVNAPEGATLDFQKKVKTVMGCVNDLMALDNWFWQWYSAKFWAQLAPYCVLEEHHTVERAWLPTGEKNALTNRLNFEEKTAFNGPRTRVWFPWEVFYDMTMPTLEPPIFKRYLFSDEEVAEKIATGEYRVPHEKRSEVRGGHGVLRNYGLEIIRSVPRKAGDGVEMTRMLKDQHEVLDCTGMVADPVTKKRKLIRWWVLNQKCVVRGPVDVTARRTENPHILCATRQVPGFAFGMPPGDSSKQIQRATNRNYNARDEAFLYGLVPPFLVGEGQNFAEDAPVIAPAAAIRLTGDARNVQLLQSRIMPTEADAILAYLDVKGHLANNTNEGMVGQFKAGTPPSAFESSNVSEGQASVLGMFMLTEEKFFEQWARLKYWTMMENCPVEVEYNGRAYSLLDMIIGEPQFDLPQLGEAAGRTADKLQIQGFFSTIAPFFEAGPITKETNPQLFAAIEKYALSLNLTDIGEILEPEQEKAKIEPAGVAEETEIFLQQKEMVAAERMVAAAKPTNGNPKGATNGKGNSGTQKERV
jgi:hypothetical protein